MKVGWVPMTMLGPDRYVHDMDLLVEQPDRLTAQNKGTINECPAHTSFVNEFFVVRAPFDLHLEYNHQMGAVRSNTLDDTQFQRFIHVRHNDTGPDGIVSITINWKLLFLSDEDCSLEVYPAFRHGTPFDVAIGSFDIYKWQRPVDFTFQLQEDADITITRGDPLYYVRFTPGPVKLIRLEWNDDIQRAVQACNLKPLQPGYSWQLIKRTGNWHRPRKFI